jgi:hypothetical protein
MTRTRPFWVIGHDAQPRGAFRPNHFSRALVRRMVRVQQRDEDVDVQERPHQ